MGIGFSLGAYNATQMGLGFMGVFKCLQRLNTTE